MSTNKKKEVAIIKPNGSKQRVDVALTQNIAGALVKMIKSGKALYDPKGSIELSIVDNEEGEKTLKLSYNTLNAWLKRGNVIPETGEILKNVLDLAREEYRTKLRVDKHKKLVRDAEREINRTLNLRSNTPVIGRFGKIKDKKTGGWIRQENVNLLKVKMDTAKFVAERLDPDTYSQQTKTENKHLVFSLADLRQKERENDAS